MRHYIFSEQIGCLALVVNVFDIFRFPAIGIVIIGQIPGKVNRFILKQILALGIFPDKSYAQSVGKEQVYAGFLMETPKKSSLKLLGVGRSSSSEQATNCKPERRRRPYIANFFIWISV